MKLVPLKSILWVVGASLLVAAGAELGSSHSVAAATSVPLFMLAVMVVAWRAGLRASIAVAVVSTLCLDFFFTEPHYSLNVTSPSDVLALVSFGCTSFFVSHLSHRIRSKSDQLQRAEEQQRNLYDLSSRALLLDWKGNVEEQLCTLIQDRFRLNGAALWNGRDGLLGLSGETAHARDRVEAAYRAERSYDLPNHREALRILHFGTRPVGALLLRGDVEPVAADAIAALVATHLERIRSLKAEVSAQSQAVSERLRTAVLDGLAHAVKTPLTTIVVSSSGLQEVGPLTPLQAELASVIESQASYLAQVTDKLLRTASLEDRDVIVHPQLISLDDVVAGVLQEVRSTQDVTRVHVQGLPTKPVHADPELLHMILLQLIENALKYADDTQLVTLSFTRQKDALTFSVHNRGSFIPAQEQDLIFERYYRGKETEHKANGTGIGLFVARQAVNAQGGRIWVESSAEAGTTFTVSLPIAAEGEQA